MPDLDDPLSGGRMLSVCETIEAQLLVKEALNKSAAAVSGSFAATCRFEILEIHKGFLRFSNLNLRQILSLTALAIDSELP